MEFRVVQSGLLCVGVEVSQSNLISTEMIRREYERTHSGEITALRQEDFPLEDLALSIEDFSCIQGWLIAKTDRDRLSELERKVNQLWAERRIL